MGSWIDAALPVLVHIGVAVLLQALGWAWPLRPHERSLRQRLAVNIAIAAFSGIVVLALLRPLVAWSLPLAAERGIGLLHLAAMPSWLRAACGFVLLDLGFYVWHRANHVVPLLWRFHAAHHADPDLDTSTALRFHPGEIALSVAFQTAQILVIGVDAATYAAYQATFQIAVLLHHSNLRLPSAFERVASTLLVGPRLHGLHHSRRREEALSNFGVVFGVWDRLLRTRSPVTRPQPAIGLPGYADAVDNRLDAVLLMPLRRQREWPAAP